MGKIVISQNVSVDGVVEDPTGEGGFEHGGWFDQYMGDDRGAWAQVEYAEALGAEALLLGRRTDEYFGTRWNAATGDWPDRLNGLPKYVVSSTLVDPVWVNSTVLKGGLVEGVSELKRALDGEIVVYASGELVEALLAHDLVDEVRLMVFPVILGSGKRIFSHLDKKQSLRLHGTQTVGNGLTLQRYEIVRDA